MNNLIQAHDMFDDFEPTFPTTNAPQQPPFTKKPDITQPTAITYNQAFDVPTTPEPQLTTYRKTATRPQFVSHYAPQQPQVPTDQRVLQDMIREIQDIERRIHVLSHSCQRLVQQGLATPQRQYQTPHMYSMYPAQQQQPTPPTYHPIQPQTVDPTHHVPEPLGIKEGVFNGEHMVSADGEIYKIPPTFACRAKLIEGDFMKAQIFSNGQVKFKQSEPIERENIMGILSTHAANTPYYIVQTASKAYKVLTEAVDMHKGSPGSQVLLIVPLGGESEWAAIESIYPVA